MLNGSDGDATMLPDHEPVIDPTINCTVPVPVPPLPSFTVTVAVPVPPFVNGPACAVAPVREIPEMSHEYVRESPSASVPEALNVNKPKSWTPNVGVAVTLAIVGDRFGCGVGVGVGLVVEPPLVSCTHDL
jgi:hypothetical protein